MKAYFWVLLAGLLACGPAERSGNIDAWVYGRENNDYRLKVTQLPNVESLQGLTGKYLRFRRGAELRLSPNDITVNRGQPLDFAYSVDEKGVVLPGDLHSFYAASIYQGFSKALAVLQSRGYEPVPLYVFYYPYVDHLFLGEVRGQFTDNAAFFPLGSAFLIMPGMMLTELPLMLNEGIAAHEYGHAVVQKELLDKRPPSTDTLDVASMNEGVSDLIGFFVTGQTNFIDLEGADRDIAQPRSFTFDDSAALYPLQTETEEEIDKKLLDPHWHGSTMARSVFEAWPGTLESKKTEAARMNMLDSLLAALRETPKGPWLWNVSVRMVSQLPPGDRERACLKLMERFKLLRMPLGAESC